MAASLRKGVSGTIGMIVPRINRHFFSNAISGVQRELNPAGLNLLIYQTEENYEKEVDGIETFMRNRVAGLIMSLSAGTTDIGHLERLSRSGVAFVQFDRVAASIPSCKITNANFQGAYDATRHLADSGFKNIAHFAGALQLDVYRERLRGYRTALEHTGRAYRPELVFENTITQDAGERTIMQALALGADALFSAGDFGALGAMTRLKEEGILIPQQFGIVGFANEPFAKIMSPALSSVDLSATLMGQRAALSLVEMLENHTPGEELNQVIPTELIIRTSSKR
jgi:LacI family transcriptional regulator